MRRTRSSLAVALTALTVAAVTSACGSSSGGGSGGDSSTLTIGFIATQTGTLAPITAELRKGVQFAVDEANAAGGVDGHKLELVMADDQGTASGGVAAAQKLVQQEHASFIIGPELTPVSAAINQRLKSLNAVFIGTQSTSDVLTGADCSSRFFRTAISDSMQFGALAEFAKDQPTKTWDVIASDYATGHDTATKFKAALQGTGQSVKSEVFPPLNTSDYGPYISRLTGADGLIVGLFGTDAANFYKQGLQFGLFNKYKVAVNNLGFNSSLVGSLGGQMTGQLGIVPWTSALDTPGTKAFNAAYQKKTGEIPGTYVGQVYLGMQTLFAGIKAAKSTDPGEVAKALSTVSFDSIVGQVSMRSADHQLMLPTLIVKAEPASGGGEELAVAESVPASTALPKPVAPCSTANG